MQIDAQAVIDRLSAKIAELSTELAIAQVQVDELEQSRSTENQTFHGEPVEGEVVD